MNRLSPHPDDGTLVRLLDGEALENAESAHVRTCTDCLSRLRILEGDGARLSRALRSGADAALMPPADLWDRVIASPEARVGSAEISLSLMKDKRLRFAHAGLRAAAVAAILLAGALTAEPVREWFAEAIRQIAGGSTAERPTPVTAEQPVAAVIVGFVPRTDRLEIRLEQSQAAGTIRVIFEDRSDATGEILTQEPAASLLVLPDGFLVRNGSGRDWSYIFRVPSTVNSTRIVVAGRTIATLTPKESPVELRVHR